jgi:hypothetical protein
MGESPPPVKAAVAAISGAGKNVYRSDINADGQEYGGDTRPAPIVSNSESGFVGARRTG